MGKKNIDPIEQADAERIAGQAEDVVAKADAERMRDAARGALLDRLTGDLPDDPKALWLIAEHSMTQACVSMIEVGRALIKLKESLPHGEFEDGLRERGIPARTAQRLMLAARKFSDRSERLLKLGRSKLYAIAEMLDDESLDKLEAGEDVLGMTLDEAERMTARDLRERLRKMEADVEVKEKLLAEKNQHIDDLATELERLKGGVQRPEDDPRIAQIREAAMRAQAALVDLHAMAGQVAEDELHVAGELHARLEELRPVFALTRETMLTRFPNLHLAMDDACTEPWRGQTVDAEALQ